MRAVALLSAALLAGCAAPAGQCRLELATSLPLTLAAHGTRLLVPARLDGHTLSLIVDTGAAVTTIAQQSLPGGDALGGSYTSTSVGGSDLSTGARLRRLELGRLHGGVAALVADRTFTVDGQPQDGLLGMDLMGGYDIDLDVPDRQLRLYAASGDCSHPGAALGPPLYSVPENWAIGEPVRSPRFDVLIDGKRFSALVDTGSPATAMFAGAAARLNLKLQDDPLTMAGGAGRGVARAHMHRLDSIRVGDLELRHVPVTVIDQDFGELDLLLGMDFVQQAHLWISNSSRTVVMQVPPHGSPPLPR